MASLSSRLMPRGGMVDVHDRRPVVLSPELAREWVDGQPRPNGQNRWCYRKVRLQKCSPGIASTARSAMFATKGTPHRASADRVRLSSTIGYRLPGNCRRKYLAMNRGVILPLSPATKVLAHPIIQ